METIGGMISRVNYYNPENAIDDNMSRTEIIIRKNS